MSNALSEDWDENSTDLAAAGETDQDFKLSGLSA
jgi:hypothetical protein